MLWYRNLRLRNKILAGFSLVIFFTTILGAISLVQLGKVDSHGENLAVNLLPSVTILSTMDNAVGTARRSELQALISGSAEELNRYYVRYEKMEKELAKSAQEFAKLDLTADEKKQLESFNAAAVRYFAGGRKTFEMARAGQFKEGITFLRQVSKKDYDECVNIVAAIQEYNGKEALQAKSKMAAAFSGAKYWIAGLLAGCILLSLLLAVTIAGTISRPVQQLAELAEQVAAGDLQVNVQQQTSDEVGQLTGSFAVMVDKLRELIGRVKDSSTALAAAANQLQATATQIATGAEEVAAQSGTVATASEEMAATSSEIAQNCTMAADGAKLANSSAEAGARVVEATIHGMERIALQVQATAQTVEALGARSDQIGAIIGTIEDIADQTNLLALNAAIEAARAGEQGRGFAVVADEVRALSERTTRATREIGEMIKAIQTETKGAVKAMEDGVHEVEKGSGEAAKSGIALQEILNGIANVTMQVNQIATAAEEQTATTTEITGNIQQISDVVQETARGAQESAIAASRLTELASELQSLVVQFKLAA